MEKEEVSQFKINLPLSLKQQLEHAAIDNRRSLSGEVIARLEESFNAPNKEFPVEDAMRLITALSDMFLEKGIEVPIPRKTTLLSSASEKDVAPE